MIVNTRRFSALKAMRFAQDVESGWVFINQYFAPGITTPFGGRKFSGFGSDCRIKSITARI